MRKLFAILCCKFAAFAGRLLGRGTSMPGKLALKLCPDILSRLSLPSPVVAVTGSNGKTSTVELLVQAFEAAGQTVCWNREGANQIEGVTTLLLRAATLRGKVHADAVVLEVDEQYTRHVFRYLTPDYLVVTNLLRDQMTRNGHPEYIYAIIRESIAPSVRLVLNADDPLTALLSDAAEQTVWFGVDAAAQAEPVTGVYHDGAHCPRCAHAMDYTYRVYAHFGGYMCPGCGHRRAVCDTAVTAIDLAGGSVSLNGGLTLHTALNILYNAYNLAAACAAARACGIPDAAIQRGIDGYRFQSGRVRVWTQNNRRITLLTSKHENSVSYDQSLAAAVSHGRDVLILVDAVSRKYFTGETSWLWDIGFERLADPAIRTVWIAGACLYDLAERFSFTDIPPDKIVRCPDFSAMDAVFTQDADLYVITCFSDRDKFITRLPADAAEQTAAL